MQILRGCVLTGSLIAVVFPFATTVQADTIWTDWTKVTLGLNGGGSAMGSVGGIEVSYSGELDDSSIAGLSAIWAPAGSFTGGTVTASPSVVGDDLRLNGSFTRTDTITFSSPVENPLLAIWSLGAPAHGASFTFNATPTLETGGLNSQFGGSSINVSGNLVSGNEGNGVVQFTGTFDSISWTDTFETYYAFTVGVNGIVEPEPAPAPTPVPEATSLTLTFIGLGLLAVARRLRPFSKPGLQRESANDGRAFR